MTFTPCALIVLHCFGAAEWSTALSTSLLQSQRVLLLLVMLLVAYLTLLEQDSRRERAGTMHNRSLWHQVYIIHRPAVVSRPASTNCWAL